MDRRRSVSIPAAALATFAAVYTLTPPATGRAPDGWTGKDASASASAPSALASITYYPGCDVARAAGAAPIYQGQPGYRPEMDGDSDGIACEPPRRDRR
jgi:hypothetical protein